MYKKPGFIYIKAFWHDTGKEFGARCFIENEEPDHDASLYDDNDIFYRFCVTEKIIRKHNHFTITAFEYEE
jgi:hypothetical protein